MFKWFWTIFSLGAPEICPLFSWRRLLDEMYFKPPNHNHLIYVFSRNTDCCDIFHWQRSFSHVISTEGHLRLQIDWASLIVGSKLTVSALFYLVFKGNFPSTSPRGAYIWRGDLTEGFLRHWFGGLYLEGLIFGILRYFVIMFPKLKSY